jgi:hypothetical protein
MITSSLDLIYLFDIQQIYYSMEVMVEELDPKWISMYCLY